MNKIATSLDESRELLRLGLDPATADFRWTNIDKATDKDGYLKYANYVLVQTDGNKTEFEGDEDAPRFEHEVAPKRDNDIPAWSLTALIELLPVLFQNTENDDVHVFDDEVRSAIDSGDFKKFTDYYPQMLHGYKRAIGYVNAGRVLYLITGSELGPTPLALGVYGGWVDAAWSTLCFLLKQGLVGKEHIVFEAPQDEDDE